MTDDMKSVSTDLVRWTFTINPAHRGAIEGHLADLGADVFVRDGNEFLVTWEEPDDDLSDVIEAIWRSMESRSTWSMRVFSGSSCTRSSTSWTNQARRPPESVRAIGVGTDPPPHRGVSAHRAGRSPRRPDEPPCGRSMRSFSRSSLGRHGACTVCQSCGSGLSSPVQGSAMSLARFGARVPIGVQVSIVAALFVAALVVLWLTGASVVARERRRSEAKGLLDRAGNALADRGRDTIAGAREFPFFTEERARAELDEKLTREAAAALRGASGRRRRLPDRELQGVPGHGPAASATVGPANRRACDERRGAAPGGDSRASLRSRPT